MSNQVSGIDLVKSSGLPLPYVDPKETQARQEEELVSHGLKEDDVDYTDLPSLDGLPVLLDDDELEYAREKVRQSKHWPLPHRSGYPGGHAVPLNATTRPIKAPARSSQRRAAAPKDSDQRDFLPASLAAPLPPSSPAEAPVPPAPPAKKDNIKPMTLTVPQYDYMERRFRVLECQNRDDVYICFFCEFEQYFGGRFWEGKRRRRRRNE